MARLRTESTGNLISISVLLFMELKPMWIMPNNIYYIFKVYISTAFVFSVSLVPITYLNTPFNGFIIIWASYGYTTKHSTFLLSFLITHRFISADYHYRSRSHITLYHGTFLKKLRPQWQ
jgi:hypothetical protein